MAYEQRKTKDREHWLKLRDEYRKKHEAGDALTLEETAIAIWNPDTEAHPMTSMGVLKIEKKALEKLKARLKDMNIKGLDDVFEAKFREYGHPVSSVYDNAFVR